MTDERLGAAYWKREAERRQKRICQLTKKVRKLAGRIEALEAKVKGYESRENFEHPPAPKASSSGWFTT